VRTFVFIADLSGGFRCGFRTVGKNILFSLGSPLDLGRFCPKSYRLTLWQPIRFLDTLKTSTLKKVYSRLCRFPQVRDLPRHEALCSKARAHTTPPAPAPAVGPLSAGEARGFYSNEKKHGLYYAFKKTAFCQNSSKSFRY